MSQTEPGAPDAAGRTTAGSALPDAASGDLEFDEASAGGQAGHGRRTDDAPVTAPSFEDPNDR